VGVIFAQQAARFGACAINSQVLFAHYWEFSMNLMRHRPYLRALSRSQRLAWWQQKKRLNLRVTIGAAWVPDSVRRTYAYALRPN